MSPMALEIGVDIFDTGTHARKDWQLLTARSIYQRCVTSIELSQGMMYARLRILTCVGQHRIV